MELETQIILIFEALLTTNSKLSSYLIKNENSSDSKTLKTVKNGQFELFDPENNFSSISNQYECSIHCFEGNFFPK